MDREIEDNQDDQNDDRRIRRDPNTEDQPEQQQNLHDSSSISQAEEEHQAIDERSQHSPSSEEEGEDLIAEGMEADYKSNSKLDKYEDEGVDEDSVSDLDPEQRRLADQEIDQRMKERMKDRRQPSAVHELSEPSEQDDLEREMRIQRQRQQQMEFGVYEDYEDIDQETDVMEEEEKFLDIEECRGKLHLWIKEERTRKWIRRTFRRFISTFNTKPHDNDQPFYVYKERIREMCNKNKQSLEITYDHLVEFNSTIALWVAEEPLLIIPYLNESAKRLVNRWYPGYDSIQQEIFIKIGELPILDKLRELRQKHVNKLIKVRGVVTRRSPVFSQMKQVQFICNKCGEIKGPFYLNNNEQVKLGSCATCQSGGPFAVYKEGVLYRNFQKITLQETPGTVLAGRVPRQKEVVLLGDNIDIARPGDEVEITGVYTHRYDYSLNVKHGFPLFFTIIEANNVKRVSEEEANEITQENIDKIRKLSRDPNVARKIIASVAPNIYGHWSVKTALALALFGGVPKDVQNKHKIRGDINVLLLGDPGVAKSQFLKSVEKVFSRTIYTTGKGASAVGLTASVKRDYSTKEWTLEGGALVLADKGVCLIDEFDKMNEYDRTSIHEAMEQQSISISKAGIVANLQARCTVIAAANPVKGKYDSQLSFHDNVDLTDPILSRFDILQVVKDEVNPEIDNALASFVINSHIKNHPVVQKFQKSNQLDNTRYITELNDVSSTFLVEPCHQQYELIPQELLKKYIMYARQKVTPKLTMVDKEKITKFYTTLRKESEISGGINIAVRHIESIIRMAEAHAKMHLRENVRDDDVDVAISVMLDSFIQSQKYSIAKILRKKFNYYLTFKEDTFSILMNKLNALYKERLEYQHYIQKKSSGVVKIPKELFEKEARTLRVYSLNEFYESALFKAVYGIEDQYIYLK